MHFGESAPTPLAFEQALVIDALGLVGSLGGVARGCALRDLPLLLAPPPSPLALIRVLHARCHVTDVAMPHRVASGTLSLVLHMEGYGRVGWSGWVG